MSRLRFKCIKHGTQATLREFSHISSTPYNRKSFLNTFWHCYQSLWEQEIKFSEFDSLVHILCHDMSANILNRTHMTAETCNRVNLTFFELYKAFQFHLYFEDTLVCSVNQNHCAHIYSQTRSSVYSHCDMKETTNDLSLSTNSLYIDAEKDDDIKIQHMATQTVTIPEYLSGELVVSTEQFKEYVPMLFSKADFPVPPRGVMRKCAKRMMNSATLNLNKLFYDMVNEPAVWTDTGMTNLPWTIRLSYAVGHVLNDLCASVWFTYTLVYFKFGIQVPTTWAGSVVLVGQLADALATPVVGYLSDRTSADSGSGGGGGDNENANQWNDFQEADENHEPLESPTTSLIANTVHAGWRERFCGWCPRGRRAWYFGGNLMVLVSFPLLFGSPIASNEERLLLKMIYYLPITVIFQVGWASAQISHLATLTDLTTSQRERTFLTSLRHLFTVLSNLAVFLGTFFLFKLTKHISGEPQRNNSSGLSPNGLQPALPVPVLQSGVVCSKGLSNFNNNTDSDIDFGVEDLGAFRNLSFGIIAVGALMTLIFLVGTRKSILPQESTSVAESEDIQLPQQNQEMVIRSWKDWLRYPLFWMLGLLYMLVRLIINVSQSYLAVYLLHSLHLPKKTTALVPLTVYLTSIITLLIQKPILDRISREVNVTIGLLFTSAFCILANYPGAPVELIRVYSASGLLGIGCTIILVTALAMVSDLIGTNQQNGAFVYGCMSFTDKLANGIVIQLIEAIWNDAYCDNYYQKVESYGIGGFVTACFVSLVIFTIVKMKMNRDTDSDNMVS